MLILWSKSDGFGGFDSIFTLSLSLFSLLTLFFVVGVVVDDGFSLVWICMYLYVEVYIVCVCVFLFIYLRMEVGLVAFQPFTRGGHGWSFSSG